MVSILMSVYNGEDYIDTAIKSVLEQTFYAFELLITNDCSTDGTQRIIERYEDNRIRVFVNDTQKGLTENLVKMAKQAKGEYLARLDADDYCEKHRLQYQYDYLQRNKDVFMVCSFAAAVGDQNGIVEMPKSSKMIASFLLFQNIIVHSSVMFRNDKRCYYDLNFRKAQDYELWDRVISYGFKIAVIPKVLVFYRYHKRQITVKRRGEQQYFADRVRMRALGRLNIKLDNDVQKDYLEFLNNGILNDEKNVDIILKLFESIKTNNCLIKLYDTNALNRTMDNLYFQLEAVARKNGIVLSKQQMKAIRSNTSFSMRLKHKFFPILSKLVQTRGN